MKPLHTLIPNHITYLFSDIDDTMTEHGKLPAEAYSALWELQAAGIEVIPITGRPAGWCDMMARFWPVRGVIGENGAFYFSYKNKKMTRHWVASPEERQANQKKLLKIQDEVLKNIPNAAISADQFCRVFDLAIDFCEDVPPLKDEEIAKIVKIFESHGATAKVSSIHVNGWFGAYDKLSMCRTFCQEELGFDLNKNQTRVAFSGDSPNDEPMFSFFENSIGVANVKNFKLTHPPKYVCTKESAHGFVELAHHLLKESTP
ncbi:MAG: HAD-IIB family hydrolase [Bdellovibrionaceae bacterium]|nr:HAD-IIB family hydrolase [Pseudobdellovibrionaceae bacterium]